MKRISFQNFLPLGKRIMLILLSILFAFLFLLIAVLWVYSPGKPKPFLDENGIPLARSISEKTYVNINGLKQGMFIKSKDSSRPVLLYIHGGMPDYFLTQKYPTGLEDYFTVIWWEQRGSGLSYHSEISPASLTMEQLVSDLIAVTNYCRQRFSKEKIYLMGHSGGTFIGIQAAAQAPELFEAYIGVAQTSNQLKSEMLAYDYMLSKFKESGDKTMVKKLEAAPVTITSGTSTAYLGIRDQAMHSLGIGTMHTMHSVIRGIFLPSLQFKEYTIPEKINLWRAKSNAGVSVIWNTILSTDLSQAVPKLDIPVYFFHGIFDYTCSYTEAGSYFEKLKAPVKGFYSFDKSAHSPIFEEPEKVQDIIRQDVLKGAANLADNKQSLKEGSDK